MSAQLRALIVEDEPLARRRLRSLLSKHGDVVIAGECESAPEALKEIARDNLDVAFVDIELAGGDGFEVAAATRRKPSTFVVFTTAYSEHAIRAFEARAVDYLLKPIHPSRLADALSRVRDAVRATAAAASSAEVARHLGNGASAFGRERLAVRAGDRSILIRIDDIDWIEAHGNYLHLHHGSRTFTIRSTLQRFSDQLNPSRFVRIHRRSVVNVDRVVEISRGVRRGEYILSLKNGARLEMQKRYADLLQSVIGPF
jgi:two-component system LytT family response regulator